MKIFNRTKFGRLFVLASLFLVLHGIEEYLTGFYNVDPIFGFLFSPLKTMSVPQSTFFVFQICLFLALIMLFLASSGGKAVRVVYGVIGFFLFFEIHHVVEALIRGGYYPGLITAIVLPIIGIFYWKELMRS